MCVARRIGTCATHKSPGKTLLVHRTRSYISYGSSATLPRWYSCSRCYAISLRHEAIRTRLGRHQAIAKSPIVPQYKTVSPALSLKGRVQCAFSDFALRDIKPRAVTLCRGAGRGIDNYCRVEREEGKSLVKIPRHPRGCCQNQLSHMCYETAKGVAPSAGGAGAAGASTSRTFSQR